jgi:uncharacterized protein
MTPKISFANNLAKQELIPKIQEMIQRLIQQQLANRLAAYPAVALTGPRQCGKTTLAKSLGGIYFDLEQESDRVRLDNVWDRLMTGKELLIVDEAQNVPGVFNRLRGDIDADRKRMGRFLLLGSVSPALMIHVSESLAGRLAPLQLTPFLGSELPAAARARLWLCGGYPDGGVIEIGGGGLESYPQWQRDYLAVLTQRDLPNWGLPAKPEVTSRLLRMLAALHGQVWNATQIGQSMGLDYKTVNTYLDYLEGTFMVRRLPPYQTNIRKRLVKSPKLYWRDTGLLHSLLNVPDYDTLLVQPWVGASWEGFIIEQALGFLSAIGKHVEPYYFRTSDQHELDLVLDFGTELWAVEIKLTSAPKIADIDRLNKVADLIHAHRRFLVTNTATNAGTGKTVSCNLDGFLAELAA